MDTATGTILALSEPLNSVPFDDNTVEQDVATNANRRSVEHNSVQIDQALIVEDLNDSKPGTKEEPYDNNEDTHQNEEIPEPTEKTEEEKRKEERRARLKRARGIRFNVEEKPKKEVKLPDSDVDHLLSDDIEKDTAFATPTLYSAQSPADIETISLEISKESSVSWLLNHYSKESIESFKEEPSEPIIIEDSIEMKTAFLNDFEVPSLSDISEESDDLIWGSIAHSSGFRSTTSASLDKGKFVDPLTGESIPSTSTSSSSSSTTSSSSSETKMSESPPALEVDATIKSDISFSDINPLLEHAAQQTNYEEDETDNFARFTYRSIRSIAIVDAQDNEDYVNRESEYIIREFLADIIKYTVNRVEMMPADEKLRTLLDKEKLYYALKEIYEEFCIAKDKHNYLNHKLADYHRRQKISRAFATLPPGQAQMEYDRYMQALADFDHYLNLVSTTKLKNSCFVKSVEEEVAQVYEVANHFEESLEDLLLHSIGDKTENLKKIVNRELRLMRIYRDEISDTRFALITRKHTLELIHDKIQKLDQISENLTANEFIDLQNQVVALEDKIDERNADLKKMRQNYQTIVHMSQHYRECTLTLQEKLKGHRKKLELVEDRRRQLRESIYRARLDHSRLKKQKLELTFQGGLLTTPVLMHDYDKTVDSVMNKQVNVKDMKETLKQLNERIEELQSTCA